MPVGSQPPGETAPEPVAAPAARTAEAAPRAPAGILSRGAALALDILFFGIAASLITEHGLPLRDGGLWHGDLPR